MFEVDVKQCKETAARQGVMIKPTFLFFRNKTKIDKLVGAYNKALENMIVHHYDKDDETLIDVEKRGKNRKRVGKELAKTKKGESRSACEMFSNLIVLLFIIGVIAWIVVLFLFIWSKLTNN